LAACTGLRVIEVTDGFNGASLCGQLFAGLGAEVIKLEAPKGDSLRTAFPRAEDGSGYLFHLLHAGKTSRLLPSEAEDARATCIGMVERADVVLLGENLASCPSDLFDPNRFCEQWPAKVLCTVSIFGKDSAREHWAGNELIAEAMGGLMSCTGYPERPPVSSGVPYAMHVSAMFAFGGIMAALYEQRRSGRGQWLDLAVVDCLIALLGNFMPSYFLSGRSPKRLGNRHTIAAPWNLYSTADGYAVICTGTGGSNWWKTITKVIDRPDLTADSRYDKEAKRVERVEEVDRIVTEWTQTRSSAQVVDLMTSGGIPASEVSSIETVLSDPHYRDIRAMIGSTKVQSGGREITIPVAGLPLKVGAWAPSATSKAQQSSGDRVQGQLANDATAGMGQPLDGIRILEFGSRTSVPMADRLLADLGADVIKIEPRKGESLRNGGQMIGGSSYLFQINNAGKRSVVIEATDPRGRDLILKLAEKAHVWLENMAPGTLEAMGLGYAALRAVNPDIIYISVSGFGLKSNYGKKRALDTVVQAACGMMHVTGYPDHLPVKLGISAVDLAAAVGLVGTVLGALRERSMTKSGMHIDLAMADIGVWMTQSVWPQILAGVGESSRLGNRSTVACPHNIFPTKDGYIAIAVDTDAQWQQLVRIMGNSSLSDNQLLATAEGRLRNVETIEAAIGAWVEGRKAIDVAAICQADGVPAAPVRTLAEVVQDPDVQRRALVVEMQHPIAGTIKLLGNPLRLSRTPAVVRRCSPVLGEHTDEILRSCLGLGDEEITSLCAAGVVMVERDAQRNADAVVSS